MPSASHLARPAPTTTRSASPTCPTASSRPPAPDPRVGVRIGDWVLDAGAVAQIGKDAVGVGDGPDLAAAWANPSLNAFLELGRPAWTRRPRLAHRGPHRRRSTRTASGRTSCPLADVTMHLPIEVGRLRRLLRQRAPRHQRRPDLPAGLRAAHPELEAPADRLPRALGHRRGLAAPTSSARSGQRKAPTDPAPTFGPSRKLDIEAELGFVVGGGTALGEPVDVDAAADAPVRGRAAQRLERPRHPGLGVRPARARSSASPSRPRSPPGSTPMAALAAARVAAARPGPASRCPTCAATADAVFGLDLHFEVEWNGTVVVAPRVPRHVLVARRRCWPT